MEEKVVDKIHLGRPLQKGDVSNLIPKSELKGDNMDIQYGSSFESQYERHWKIKG